MEELDRRYWELKCIFPSGRVEKSWYDNIYIALCIAKTYTNKLGAKCYMKTRKW